MNQLWYLNSANCFEEALPVGNGRLGAMVYGNTDHEIIDLNEESIWSAPYKNRNNPSCLSNIDSIRALLKGGKVEEAQDLARQTMSGTPSYQSMYQTAGQLHIDYYTDLVRGVKGPVDQKDNPFANPFEYKRSLDLSTAIATTEFSVQSITPSNADFAGYQKGSSVTYTREVFVSAKSDVLVIRISSTVPKSIYFRMYIERGSYINSVRNLNEEDTLALTSTSGIPFATVAHVACSGGKVCGRGEYIVVEGADEATIYIDIETAYRNRHYRNKGGNVSRLASSYAFECMDKALRKVCLASGQTYSDLKKEHLNEYQNLYSVIKLNLGTQEQRESLIKIPTDELLKKHPSSPLLCELYWNYSRYLLLSSSRKPGVLPANLQGLWCKDMEPSWGSKFTINVNTQMNYWGANMNGLSDTELNLFYLMSKAYKKGVMTAKTMYGCRGWVAHHNTDIWGDTAPQDKWLPGTYWVMGAAWLSTHIWEHYLYTLDKKFLKKYYYLMEDACQFFADYMVPNLTKQYLVVNPTVSPENTYKLPNGQIASLCEGCDMDNRILEQLFDSTINAAAVLGKSKNNSLIDKISSMKQRIESPVITSEGTIREWANDCTEVDPGHRHISQLYGLYPGQSINYYKTPQLCEASSATIDKRLKNGGGHTGWSQAWIMNFRASLHQNEEAQESLNALFDKSTLPNLLDNHPPFQIDGNFGAMAAMTRFIVQSNVIDNKVDIDVLPCLPPLWNQGRLEGVCLKGNLRMNIEWKDGKLTEAKIYTIPGSNFMEEIVIHYDNHTYETTLLDGKMDLFNVITVM